VVWEKGLNTFLGINAFGIRLRHEKFDQWLREKKTVDFVLDQLPEANFDPEFTERHDKQIRDLFLKSIRNS
jgi:hypothetical protein